jgi:threonine dehydrogenase-like Zn-dependent dehydrogenase
MVVQITTTAICGSDLHLFDGVTPAMQPGDILRQEPMGEVAEVGSDVKKLKRGDRVAIAFVIAAAAASSTARASFRCAIAPTRAPSLLAR